METEAFESVYASVKEELARISSAMEGTIAYMKDVKSSTIKDILCEHLDNLSRSHNRLSGSLDILLTRKLNMLIEEGLTPFPGPVEPAE